MKKFINTTSIITAVVVLLLDISIVAFLVLCTQKMMEQVNASGVIFAVMMVFAAIVAIKVTANQFKTGIEFEDDKCVFNALDSDNEFFYKDIEKIEIQKDDKISFTKNFIDRYGHIALTMSDGRIHTITLGLVTRKKLVKIKEQIEMRKSKKSK